MMGYGMQDEIKGKQGRMNLRQKKSNPKNHLGRFSGLSTNSLVPNSDMYHSLAKKSGEPSLIQNRVGTILLCSEGL
jgi:hypothetical protein